MTSHVYLLKHASEPRMKIGKANSVPSRVASLGREQFDLEDSWIVRVPDEGTALDLEKALSKLLRRFSVPRPREEDGGTEWYELACLDRALGLLEREADLFSGTVLRAGEDPAWALARPSDPHRRPRTPTLQETRAKYDQARRENAEVLRAFAADLLAFRQVVHLFSGTGEAHDGSVQLFFLAREEASYDEFRAAFEALGNPHHHGGGNLFLPRAGMGLFGGGFSSPAWEGEQHRGYIWVRNPGDPYVLQFVSAEALVSLRAALEGLEACPPALQEEIEARDAESRRTLSETSDGEACDRIVTPRRKKP